MRKTRVNSAGKHYNPKFISNNVHIRIFNMCEVKCSNQREEQICNIVGYFNSPLSITDEIIGENWK